MSDDQRVVFLKGPRVILRPIAKSDLPRIVRWINDPEVRLFIGTYLPVSETDEEEWIANLGKHKPNDVVLAIETTEGLHIGSMGLHKIHWGDRVATTGALIGEKEFWGRGYGTEAKMLLLDYAFNALNLRKICSHVIAYNQRSRRYSEKCGYHEEGVLKRHVFRNGKYWDLVQLAIFAEDFSPLWEKWQKEHQK